MKVYAYVLCLTVVKKRAFKCGEKFEGMAVSAHRDLIPWCQGKKRTREMAKGINLWPHEAHLQRYAKSVVKLLGW